MPGENWLGEREPRLGWTPSVPSSGVRTGGGRAAKARSASIMSISESCVSPPPCSGCVATGAAAFDTEPAAIADTASGEMPAAVTIVGGAPGESAGGTGEPSVIEDVLSPRAATMSLKMLDASPEILTSAPEVARGELAKGEPSRAGGVPFRTVVARMAGMGEVDWPSGPKGSIAPSSPSGTGHVWPFLGIPQRPQRYESPTRYSRRCLSSSALDRALPPGEPSVEVDMADDVVVRIAS
mmetsp:Transcript_22886/g.58196  ORF Transcript_22886/g.58196 Transcript_22886/m.58196 type:complete len:239 (-) Transcript_22886:608-1324(-)